MCGYQERSYGDYISPWLETSLRCTCYDCIHPFQLSPNAKALFASLSDWKKQGYLHGVAFAEHSSLQWWAQLFEQLLHLHMTRPMCKSPGSRLFSGKGEGKAEWLSWEQWILLFLCCSFPWDQRRTINESMMGENYRTLWKGLPFISQRQPERVCSWKRIANKMGFHGWLYVIYKPQTGLMPGKLI